MVFFLIIRGTSCRIRAMVEITDNGSYFMLTLKIEELDFIKTPKFSEYMREKLDEISYPNIILDLENLYYIDSTGLSSLINISRKIKDRSNEMVVVCNSVKILQLFDIAKIGMFFKIFDTIQNAENYFNSTKLT
jgi:anti-anti-sigma factor